VGSCAKCGAQLESGATCASCESRNAGVLKAESGHYQMKMFEPSTIIDGVDPATGDAVIKVDAPGTKSEARLGQDDLVSFAAQGAAAIGTKGEPRLLKTLRQTLEASGLAVTVSREDARDARGEDAILLANNRRYIVQVVTSPGIRRFWQEARAGSALAQVDSSGAVQWIRLTLDKKTHGTRPAQWAKTLLAIDAGHSGILADPRITESYLCRFGPPAVEFGVASVWIVGPTTRFCVRLGPGTP
jgi:hypothetical protein